jgi:hypothetical protein
MIAHVWCHDVVEKENYSFVFEIKVINHLQKRDLNVEQPARFSLLSLAYTSRQIFKRVCPPGTIFLLRSIALEYSHEEPGLIEKSARCC